MAGGLLGFAKNVLSGQGGSGAKFSKSDVKKVYFVSIAALTLSCTD